MVSQVQLLKLLQGIPPCRFSMTACWQVQAETIFDAPQLCGHQQDFVTERSERGVLEIRGQAQPLKPVHEIVGPQGQMEVGLVSKEVAGGDVA